MNACLYSTNLEGLLKPPLVVLNENYVEMQLHNVRVSSCAVRMIVKILSFNPRDHSSLTSLWTESANVWVLTRLEHFVESAIVPHDVGVSARAICLIMSSVHS